MTKTLKQQTPVRVIAALAVLAVAGGITAALLSQSQPLPRLTPAQQHYLTLADQGIAKTSEWWNGKAQWYDAVRHDQSRAPLAKLWDTNGLFEALDEVASAHPSSQNLAAVTAFANGSERYWNPNLKPVGGYSPYVGDRKATQQTWYDDNGWIGLGFLDAYRVTRDSRYLTDAERAAAFIAAGGWDKGPGGMWWSTAHPWRSGEALACASDLAASLYQVTGRPMYLRAAEQYIGWADKHLLKAHGVYLPTADHPYPHLIEPPANEHSKSAPGSSLSATARPVKGSGNGVASLPQGALRRLRALCPHGVRHCNQNVLSVRRGVGQHGPYRAANAKPTMVAMPHDGEGAMLAAITALCEKTGRQSWCQAAEKLAGNMIVWLAPFADGPQYDSVLVRGLLTLYAHDHNPRWYRFAVAIAHLISTHARTGAGLYLKGWDGQAVPSAQPGLLRTDAGSVGVFADLATVAPPHLR
jgi:hypothetical protein